MSDEIAERPFPTVPEVEAALGALVMAFSQIELRVQQLIWALVDDEAAGQILTAGMSYKRSVMAAEQLWRIRVSEEEQAELNHPVVMAEVRRRDPKASSVEDYVFKRLKIAEDTRNQMLHSWWPDPAEPYWTPTRPVDLGGSTLRWKADRKTGILEPHIVPLDDIRQTAREFNSVMGDLATMIGFIAGRRAVESSMRVGSPEPSAPQEA